MSMSSTSNRLAELREAREWHRSRIGAMFNVGDRTVARWENGESPIPSTAIPQLAELFEVTPEFLMAWDHEGAKT
jgi:transcriptional regulator with XRE-family HTH domain